MNFPKIMLISLGYDYILAHLIRQIIIGGINPEIRNNVHSFNYYLK